MITAAEFDAASAAWMANKLRRGASMAYRCQAITKTGDRCSRAAESITKTIDDPALCKSHRKYSKPTQLAPWSGSADSPKE